MGLAQAARRLDLSRFRAVSSSVAQVELEAFQRSTGSRPRLLTRIHRSVNFKEDKSSPDTPQ
jgi:hypothetical protein